MGNSVADRRDIIDVYFDSEFEELDFTDGDSNDEISIEDMIAREALLGF